MMELYVQTASLRTKDNNRIPKELEEILSSLSEKIPVCIISSKDFAFLHERTRFANVLSCVLGIETIVHNPHYDNNKTNNNFDCIRMRYLIASRKQYNHSLSDNSIIFSEELLPN